MTPLTLGMDDTFFAGCTVGVPAPHLVIRSLWTKMTDRLADEHRWKFEPVFNLGHVFMLLGLLASGLTVYVGVIKVQTNLSDRLDALEKTTTPKAEAAHDLATSDHADLIGLKGIADDIRRSNAAMLDQLTSIRVDVAVLKGRVGVAAGPKDGVLVHPE